MEPKDYILIVTNVIGWGLAVAFFVLKRKAEKTDKALDKRFEVYSKFLVKADDLFEKLRNDPSVMVGIHNEFLQEVLQYHNDEAKVNETLLKFNGKILEWTRQSIKPLQVIKSELNNLKLVASEALLAKIEEFKEIATDYNNHFQKTLNSISSESDKMIEDLKTLSQDERGFKIADLYKEITELMRNEIGYYNK